MKIKNSVQLTAALNYVKNLPMGDPVNTSLKQIDTKIFEEYCGIGVEISKSQIAQEVDRLVKEIETVLLSERYQYNTSQILYQQK